MTAAELLSSFGQTLDIDDLEFADNGTCHLIFGDDLEFTIEEVRGENAVYVFGDVCAVPASDQAGFYARLLDANLFGSGTGDATFAVNKETNTVILHKRIPLGSLQPEDFQAQVQEFANWLITWKSDLAPGDSGEVGATSESTSDGGGFIRV